MKSENNKLALGRLALVTIVVIVILLILGAGIFAITRSASSSSTTTSSMVVSSTSLSSSLTSSSSSQKLTTSSSTVSTSSSSIQSTSTSGPKNSTLTYETIGTFSYLDPNTGYAGPSDDLTVLLNVYEPLLWFNGSCSTCIVPWLAQSYTASSDLKAYNFTLRNDITFQDGEVLNSTAVYFSLNRAMLLDGSTPQAHGIAGAFDIQQMLNTSLSSSLCGCTLNYNQQYYNSVMAEDFVQITSPTTFTINVQNPNAAFAYIMAVPWITIMAPEYVMQHDLAIWNQSSSGYTLPYSSLSGPLMNQIQEYFQDMLATCNAGVTPSGCGNLYLDGSYQGSMAGTGPYEISSYNPQSNILILKANPTYWGGGFESSNGTILKIKPQIQNVIIKTVPDESTRELDLQNAARSGQAMTIDVSAVNLYDVADRSAWLNNNVLESVIPGVTLWGPYSYPYVIYTAFNTNVSNALTGDYYSFQPFSDFRFRLAFADAVNTTALNIDVNNGLGIVPPNLIPPGLAPNGSFNPSIKPIYSYNLTAVQDELLSAMENPITSFTFFNGTSAPTGFFNNTFGCPALNSNGQCNSPVSETISLTYPSGNTFAESVYTEMAEVVNNVSSTYNMGLTVSVIPIPSGMFGTEAYTPPTKLYSYYGGWIPDYPWVVAQLQPNLAPLGAISYPDGWNVSALNALENRAATDTSNGNTSDLLNVSNQMNAIANNMVLYLYTTVPYLFITATSNVHGIYFNWPVTPPNESGGTGPSYFATLYLS